MKKKISAFGLIVLTIFMMGCISGYNEVEAYDLINNTEFYLNGWIEVELYIEYYGTKLINGKPSRMYRGYEIESTSNDFIWVKDPMMLVEDVEVQDDAYGMVKMGVMDNTTIYYLFLTQKNDIAECMANPNMEDCGSNGDDDVIIIPFPIPIDN